MNYKHNLIKERFDIHITSEGQTVKGEFELDKNAQFLVGIALTSSRDDFMFYRGSQKIQLNDMELFPEGFESKLLMAGLNVAPDNRMITLDTLPTGNGKIEMWYRDSASTMGDDFETYRVTIYTFCLVEKPQN